MSRGDPTITRYLARHAEPNRDSRWPFGQTVFDVVVVVPAFVEEAGFIDALWQHPTAASVLLIVVVNAPDSAHDEQIRRTEELLHKDWSALAQRAQCVDGVAWLGSDARRGLWLIDRVRPEHRITAKAGVGLARKIGMDIALRAIHETRIRRPLIWCCDADGTWPGNYFDVDDPTTYSALTFAFEHVGSLARAPEQRVYDLRLRDYPVQLARAGSGYAFQALGSSMAVSARHYAQVGGCPKRAAGEDFHLLAKLAKVGDIEHRPDVRIQLQARYSTRVPFGTGPGVARLAMIDDPWCAPVFYSSRSFAIVARLLRWLDRAVEAPPSMTDCHAQLQEQICGDDINAPVDTLIDITQWHDAVQRAASSSPQAQRRRQHVHVWFDALRTLRLIHQLRDAGLGNVSARELARLDADRLAGAGAIEADWAALNPASG